MAACLFSEAQVFHIGLATCHLFASLLTTGPTLLLCISTCLCEYAQMPHVFFCTACLGILHQVNSAAAEHPWPAALLSQEDLCQSRVCGLMQEHGYRNVV